MKRFRLAWLLLLIAPLMLPPAALAQTWPVKPIRLIVPYPTGGITEVVARLISQHLGAALGQTVVPDFRPGASLIIGAEMTAKSAPDGYTLFIGSGSSHTLNPHLFAKLPYDPLKDFDSVIRLAAIPYLVAVHPSLPANNVRELVAYAKANPGKISYGSFGNGTIVHLATELLKQAAGIDMVHVPYKGSAAAELDLVAGRIQMMTTTFTVVPQSKDGRVKILAVTPLQRSPLLPDVPTVAESGYPGFEVTGWFGIFTPAGVPRDVLRRLTAEMDKVLKLPEVVERFRTIGLDPGGGTAEQLTELVRVEHAKWGRVIREANIKLN